MRAFLNKAISPTTISSTRDITAMLPPPPDSYSWELASWPFTLQLLGVLGALGGEVSAGATCPIRQSRRALAFLRSPLFAVNCRDPKFRIWSHHSYLSRTSYLHHRNATDPIKGPVFPGASHSGDIPMTHISGSLYSTFWRFSSTTT